MSIQARPQVVSSLKKLQQEEAQRRQERENLLSANSELSTRVVDLDARVTELTAQLSGMTALRSENDTLGSRVSELEMQLSAALGKVRSPPRRRKKT